MSATVAPTRPAPAGLGARTVGGAIVAFVLIGVQQALYGPAIPALSAQHGLTAGAAGAALSVHFAGAILGVFALPAARRRGIADGVALGLSLALIAAGLVAFLAAPDWPLALVAAGVAGIGFGGIDGGVNQLFTEAYAERGHGMLNLLHGCFGAGAILGPVAVGLLPTYRWSFAACAALALVAVPLLGRARTAPAPPPSAGPGRRGTVGVVGLLLVGFFVLNVGLETGAGGWETTHLIATGRSEAAAASATSGFWLAFTAVRFAVVPLCRRFAARTIVLACTALTVVAALATLAGPVAPYAYALLGVAIGPLFPTGLAWQARLRPDLTSTVVAVSMVGGVAFPPALGLAVQGFGAAAVPWGLTVVAVAGGLAVGLLARAENRTIDAISH